jgi:hypothetical protein
VKSLFTFLNFIVNNIFYFIIRGIVYLEGTATTIVACLATVTLYLWETVVTPRGFSSVATLWP